MKNLTLSTLFSATLLCILLTSCESDVCQEAISYTRMEPVYMTYEEFRTPIQSEAPRPLRHPGKIYIKGGYLFINEVNAGIHVIDNRNPQQPTFVSFISIPGNVDLAAQGDYLYVDSHIDLVTLDISNPEQVKEVDRQEEIFYFPIFVDFFGPAIDFNSEEGILTSWREVEVTQFVDCNEPFVQAEEDVLFLRSDQAPFVNGLPAANADFSTPGGESAPGTGGSMARFTIQKQHLYAVTEQDLIVFNLETPSTPDQLQRLTIGWNIETIFPFQDVLLIGSQTGMFIYSTETPGNPYQLSVFEHMRSCDPVVAEGDIAYVTLREGSLCPGGRNQLDVIDISNLTEPTLLRSFPMYNPHGLGIKENTLFVCEAEEGLKVFDATNIATGQNLELPLIANFKDIHAYDVIPLYDLLLMIGQDGFYQYDYSDLDQIELVSFIPVEKE